MVRLLAIIHLVDRFQHNSLHNHSKNTKKDFGNPITIALKKLNCNRIEFRNSNQQLKYLVTVQRTGSSITFKEFKLLLNFRL